jgi:prepilin-type N-terminal cleavage/methylation domain-containing protein
MFTAQVKTGRRGAFTLLEITLAVAILAMMSLAIYRFVQTNVTALRISSEANVQDAQYSGFQNLLSAQWQSLSPGIGALLGEPLKLNDRSRDEITWICVAGPGLLTRYAVGEYRVSMRLRPMSNSRDEMELGLMRKLADGPDDPGGDENWMPLLPHVQSLQLRYFDPRLNTWVDKWTDTVTLPRLVKVAIGRANDTIPWEAIVALGRTPL